ncbi:MAG: EcsC family protein [Actinomycetota bacterium]|nr:EcsC family protein [Actinomycetota bacterium]
MTTPGNPAGTPEDAGAFDDVENWKQRWLRTEGRRRIPARLRDRLGRAGAAARQRLENLPGADRFETLFLDALRGLTDLGARAAHASIRREAILTAYRKRGHDVQTLHDIRRLDLSDITRVKPRLDLAYVAASTVEGAGAGFAVSAGQILAASGAVVVAGAGAGPGAGTVVAALAADAAAVLVASHRAIGHIAAYYGYDVDEPEERLFALGVLDVGTAADATAKYAAYAELHRVAGALVRQQSWMQLNEHVIPRIVAKAYTTLGLRLTQRKLVQAIPVAGIVIGAGLNAKLLSRIVDDAEHLYRERFLRERYGITRAEKGPPDGAVPINDIVDAEIVEDSGPAREG